MKKIFLYIFPAVAAISCKKEMLDTSTLATQNVNSVGTPIEKGQMATTYEWQSTRYYNGTYASGSTEFKNFNWDGTNDAAFAHNVYNGGASSNGYQTLWGSLPETINGYKYTALRLNVFHPGGGALPYPKIKKNINKPFNNINTLTSYVDMSFPATNSNMQYNAAYDIYFDYPAYQGSFKNYLAMMVWLKQEGNYGPAGERLRWANGSQNVFRASNGIEYKLIGRLDFSGHARIINFVTMTETNSLSVNLKELMQFVSDNDFQYTEGNGTTTWIKTNLSGATLQDINVGWEIHSAFAGSSTPVDFYINRYRCDVTTK